MKDVQGKCSFWRKTDLKLYCCYGLSTWTEQMWMFSAGMAFGRIGGDLQLAASAAFVASAAVLLVGPSIGKWIDSADRIRAGLFALTCTKIFSSTTMALLSSMLFFGPFLSAVMNGELLSALSIVCIFVNMVSILATLAFKTIITKDWVVVLCHGDEDRLTGTNAILSRINLITMILSPYIAGQLTEWSSVEIGCFTISVFILTAFSMEFFLLKSLHRDIPDLSIKSKRDHPSTVPLVSPAPPVPPAPPNGHPNGLNVARTRKDFYPFTAIHTALINFVSIWRIYWHQRVLLAGITMALLYMTVLGFDSITDVYALSQGLKANTVALVKGSGAVAGVCGTFLYPRIRRRIGLVKTGIIGVVLQLSCLVMPVVSIWLPGSPFDPYGYYEGTKTQSLGKNSTEMDRMENDHNGSKISVTVFLIGLVLSRCGLWLEDLTINQLFQQTVIESERATVNGVQNALNNLMDMLKSILVIFMPSPKTFGLLIILSWLFIFAAFLSYAVFARRVHQKGGGFEWNHQKEGVFERSHQKGGEFEWNQREPTECEKDNVEIRE